MLFNLLRLHVCGGLLHGSTAALLVRLAGQSVCWKSHEDGGQEGSGGPADCLTDHRDVVFFRWEGFQSLLALRSLCPSSLSAHIHTLILVMVWAHNHFLYDTQTYTDVRRSQRSYLKTCVSEDKSRRMSISEVDWFQRSSVKSLTSDLLWSWF